MTDVTGSFQIRRGDKSDFEKGVWGVQLFRGDQIKTPDNAQVSLLFQNGNLITLGPGSSLTVADNYRTGSLKSVRSLDQEMAANIALPRSGGLHDGDASALAGLRAGSSETALMAISPRNTKIKSDRPSFEWNMKQQYDGFTLTLLSDVGVVWKQKATGSRMEYPAGIRPLERGKSYYWFVEGEGLFETAKSSSVAFTLLDAGELKAVEEKEQRLRDEVGADGSSLHFLLGTYYDRQGMLADALVQFELIAAKNVDAPLPHEILGSLYERLGLKDAAIHELQQTVALSQVRK